jgi:heme exporter protein D
MTALAQFFHMGGYAFYVWMSYGSVLALLFLQWFLPWRRFKRWINE